VTPPKLPDPNVLSERLADLGPEQVIEFLVQSTIASQSSDLFLQNREADIEVSVRRYGMLSRIALLNQQQGMRVLSHIRAEAGMNHAEHHHPTTGRWVVEWDNSQRVDLRLHSLPTLWGECLAIRILRRQDRILSLDGLGFVNGQRDKVRAMLHKPGGLIVVSGPAGCGKTSTAYAFLHYLNDGRRSIYSIESPVEYPIDGVRQTQFEPGRGVSLHEMLNAVLRQGPDAVMLSEIRDAETARMAVDAANGGRLVIATMNAPYAATAIERLLDFGVPAYILSSALLGVLAQRLIRRLNDETRIPVDLSRAPDTFSEVSSLLKPGEGTTVYAADPGTPEAQYDGEVSIFEVLTMTKRLRRLISDHASANDLTKAAVDAGMIDFRAAALVNVARGVTSFDEMQRIVPFEDLDVA
jgi:type II secretory ATPase GspE/PulE/Tfp pilus assembly ATPase PilB-like protein